MLPSAIETTLQDLDATPDPSVVRFDAGAPFAGRVAVLPSAFNPPTAAHLHLLEVAREVDGVQQTAALLSTRNVAKGVFGASLAHRIGMLLAIHAVDPWVAVLATNAARLADQSRALRAAYPASGFDFVVGHDTLIRLFDPVYYDDMAADLSAFFGQHRVIATNRGDASIEAVQAFVDTQAGGFADRIIVREIDHHPASLSSTSAREAVAGGLHPVSVASPVADYIREHALYRDGPTP
jgi:nicotinamide-nucleotide adenylyltransferase